MAALQSLVCFLSLLAVVQTSLAQPLQPHVTTVEAYPSRRVFGSVSFPLGHPLCDGNPTYWLVGHEGRMESPHCLVTNHTGSFENYDFTGSIWKENRRVRLQNAVDRHDCASLDLNQDNIPDFVCGVGARKGTDVGWNEIYLTNLTKPSNTGHRRGYLVQSNDGHGLWKYPTVRNRLMVTLKGSDNSTLLLLASKGVERVDGLPNQHRLFKLTHPSHDPTVFHFDELPEPRPWVQHTEAKCLVVGDINNDGLDDIVMCNLLRPASIFIQQPDGTFVTLPTKQFGRTFDWRNVRIADFNGDGISDLVVVGNGGNEKVKRSYIRVFQGQGDFPYFDFKKRSGMYYLRTLPFASPDVEVIDANGDGKMDIYVVQVDERTPGYCSGTFRKEDHWGTTNQPPNDFVPPLDMARDMLFLATNDSAAREFRPVFMRHREPGCGFFLESWNNRTLLLGQGTNSRPGHNLLLQW